MFPIRFGYGHLYLEKGDKITGLKFQKKDHNAFTMTVSLNGREEYTDVSYYSHEFMLEQGKNLYQDYEEFLDKTSRVEDSEIFRRMREKWEETQKPEDSNNEEDSENIPNMGISSSFLDRVNAVKFDLESDSDEDD